MKLNVKLSKFSAYSVHEEVDSTIISIGSLNWQENQERQTRTTVSYIFNNKYKNFLNCDEQKTKSEEIVGLYIYNNSYQEWNENRQNILINRKNKKLQKLLNKNIIEVGEKDYAFYINQNKIISGIYNTNICYCSGQESQSKIRKRSQCQNSIEFKDRYITGITKMDDTSILLTYTNQKNEDSHDYLSTSFCVYDVQSQITKWMYSKPRQAIAFNPLKIDNSCFLTGHLDLHENSADLILHDTRLRSCVYILDTSRQEFGSASWIPYYSMLYKLNLWQVATVWGGPAGKINHIIKLDIRYPLKRQIIVKSIEHPKYFHRSTFKQEQYWMIRNEYKEYRYTNTIIEKNKFEKITQ